MRFFLQANLVRPLGLLLLAAVLVFAGRCQMPVPAQESVPRSLERSVPSVAEHRAGVHSHGTAAHPVAPADAPKEQGDCCDTSLKACCSDEQALLQDRVAFQFWSAPLWFVSPQAWAGWMALVLGFALPALFGQKLPPPRPWGLVQQKTQLSC